jgi:hypothetical protein
MHYFCTYCDQGYVARLLCLHGSLLAQREPFRLFVLCFDDVTARVVADAGDPGLIGISLPDFLTAEPEYAAVRPNRTKVEFYFTATPVLVRYCFGLVPDAGQMTYLDSDLYFFGPASAVFAEQGEASIGIVPHRFPARLAHLLKWGVYNVAWVSFRRDRDGLACLEWWRARCLEWCHDHIDHGRFADQGYLNGFPGRFGGVGVVDHVGINAGPWNMDAVQISKGEAEIMVNGRVLLFYHFQGIREVLPNRFETGLRNYRTALTSPLRDLIYLPYLKKLVEIQSWLKMQYGIEPLLGFQRLPSGGSLRNRWDRFFARRLLPAYRRLRGQLLHCATPKIATFSKRPEDGMAASKTFE